MAEQADVLSKFLEELHREECEFRVPEQVVADVKDAVEELVHGLMSRVATQDPRFIVSEILNRGSIFEGTRIRLPDEFDYVVILGEISKPGTVELKRVCNNNSASVHVIVLNSSLAQLAREASSILPYDITSRFKFLLRDCFWEVYPGYSNTYKIEKDSGYLLIEPNIFNHVGPNACLDLKWITTIPGGFESFMLSVDVTPAIRFQSPGETKADQSGEVQLLAVPAPTSNCEFGGGIQSLCWRVSYSDLEFAKMEAMSETHKSCYRLLKYLCRKTGEFCGSYGASSLKSLTSYMLKTAVFHHSDSCQEEGNLGRCLQAILYFLSQSANDGFLPHYFIPAKNMWDKHKKTGKIVTPQKIVHDLLGYLQDIAGMQLEVFVFGVLAKRIKALHDHFSDIEVKEYDVLYPPL